jgi:hypothetical protein
MPFILLLGLLSLSFSAAAQYDAGGQNTQGADVDAGKLDPATKARIRTEGSVGGIPGDASSGASGNAARARAGGNASVEGGAAIGATGINTQPAAKAEAAEKDERQRNRAPRKAD